MELSQQVVSLDLAKRLKELGVKQESLFYWHNVDIYPTIMHSDSTEWAGDILISAFTVAELGELLPAILKNEYYFTSVKLNDLHHWGADYRDWKNNDSFCFADTEAETEADARAKMIIFLLENNLIKSE